MNLESYFEMHQPFKSKIFCDVSVLFLVFLFYFSFAFYFFGSLHSWTTWYLGGDADPISFVWFLAWWPFAIIHGLNPFITNYVWYPAGYNLCWATSIPFASLIMFPITAFWGPVLAYNILSIISPVLAASSAFALAEEITSNFFASFVGGFIFGFSSYESSQILVHLNLDSTYLVPILILLCIRRQKAKTKRNHFVLLFSFILLAQLGTSAEVLATSCLVGAFAWLILVAIAPKQDRNALFRLLIDLLFSGLIFLIFASPFLFYFVKGMNDFPSTLFSAVFYSADFLNFFIPTSVTLIGHTIFAADAAQFTGNIAEQGAYLGIPSIAIFIIFVFQNSKNVYLRGIVLTTILIFVLSLGPRLQIAGNISTIILPWKYFLSLPLIRAALPTRLTMFISLCIAIIVAIWLAQATSKSSRIIRFSFGLLACLFLFPNQSAHYWSPWPVNSFFSDQHIRQVLQTKKNVMIFPFSDTGPGMAWQVNSKFQFTQSAGYIGFPPRNEGSLSILRELRDGVPGPEFENELSEYCISHKVDYILMGPTTPLLVKAAVEHFRWPQHLDETVEVVQVPPLKSLGYGYIQGDYWPSQSILNFMGKHVDIITNDAPHRLIISGRNRPHNNPLIIVVSNQFGKKTYSLINDSQIIIQLPASGKTSLTALETFVPDDIFRNGDERNLSAMIAIQAD